jgi:hypothetical protein
MKNETSVDLADMLCSLDACRSAVEWVEHRYDLTLSELWDECDRGDWMLWLAARVGVDRKLVVRTAADCVETALRYVPPGESRPRTTVETVRRWLRDEATNEEVRIASLAAADYAASATDDAYAASRASWATVSLAKTSIGLTNADVIDADNAYAADCVAIAIADVAYAEDAATDADDDARVESLARIADLVRARINVEMIVTSLANGDAH